MATSPTSELAKLRIARADEAPAQKRRGKPSRGGAGRWLSRLLFLTILGGLGWLAWPFIAPKVAEARAPMVKTDAAILLRPGANLEITTASGYVVARTRAALAARVAGQLVDLRVDVGSLVAKNDLIAQIDPRVYALRLAEAQSAVLEFKAEQTAAEAQIDIADRRIESLAKTVLEAEAAVGELSPEIAEAQRVLLAEEELSRTGAGLPDQRAKADNEVRRLLASQQRRQAAVSMMQSQKASAESERRAADARVAVARTKVKQAEERVLVAEVELSDTEIRAPFAGVILRKEAELGEIVVPALAGGSTSRGAVVTMADFDSLEMEVDVFERDIGKIIANGEALILVNALGESVRLPGRVRQIVPTADRTKGTVQVKVSFVARDPRVVPELNGKVIFLREKPTADLKPEVRAPRRALTTRAGETGVWLFEAGRLRWRAVKTGADHEDLITIEQGLNGGEVLVVDPDAALGEGMQVRLEKTT